MKEINFITEAYRENLAKLRVFKLSIIGIVIFLTITGASFAAITQVKNSTNKEIEKLTKVRELAKSQLDQLALLDKEKQDLDEKWNLLKGLRSTSAPEDLFYAIDLSLKDLDVWFTQLRYERKEHAASESEFIETGYFIIISPNKEKDSYAIGTTLMITGGSSNHSTLSSFVKNLLNQTSINDAKVLETSTDASAAVPHINFTLEIKVQSESYKS